MDRKLLGKRINIARKGRKMTGDKLAEICNISPTYLRQIEAGTKLPSLPVFVTLCRALKASPSYLLMDSLGENEACDMDLLFDLWKKATPSQMRLVTAMIQVALESTNE